MNNVKLKKGDTAFLGNIAVRGLPYARKPKHTQRERDAICGCWVNTMAGGKQFIPGYTQEQLRQRSRNRRRNRIAKASRRRNRS